MPVSTKVNPAKLHGPLFRFRGPLSTPAFFSLSESRLGSRGFAKNSKNDLRDARAHFFHPLQIASSVADSSRSIEPNSGGQQAGGALADKSNA